MNCFTFIIINRCSIQRISVRRSRLGFLKICYCVYHSSSCYHYVAFQQLMYGTLVNISQVHVEMCVLVLSVHIFNHSILFASQNDVNVPS